MSKFVAVDGEMLKLARDRQLLTLSEAARLSGLSRESIRRLEHEGSGALPSTLRMLGRIYGVNPRVFIAAEVYEKLGEVRPELEPA
jgi:transcriptional regulator with XRE-family HTH domain